MAPARRMTQVLQPGEAPQPSSVPIACTQRATSPKPPAPIPLARPRRRRAAGLTARSELLASRAITAIGKELPAYDAVDTGMFRLPPSVFGALGHAYDKNGDCTLSDGIRELAEGGRMDAFDIGEAYWQDVDTPETLKHAEWLLRAVIGRPTLRIAQASGAGRLCA